MKRLRVIIRGDAPADHVERTRGSVGWAASVEVRPATERLGATESWTLVLYPGEILAADAPVELERQLATAADCAIRIRTLTTLCGSVCTSDFFAPAPEVRLLRAPAVGPGAGLSGAPVLHGLFIHRDLGDSPDVAAAQLPVEARAESALAKALEAWRQRERASCSIAERRALALYTWRLLVEADRADGERLSSLLTLPVVAQARM